jgi:hypothetical protein
MSADNSVEITLLIEKVRNGDKLAENRLAKLLTPELRPRASVYLRRDFRCDSMKTGDLVNEIYLRASPFLKSVNDQPCAVIDERWRRRRRQSTVARSRAALANKANQFSANLRRKYVASV